MGYHGSRFIALQGKAEMETEHGNETVMKNQ